jgi:hypothetical protein
MDEMFRKLKKLQEEQKVNATTEEIVAMIREDRERDT